MNILLIIVSLIALALTRLYLVIPKRNKKQHRIKKYKRDKPCKTCIFLGSGGHTAEMLQLIKSLNRNNYYPRTYVVANTDILSKEKAVEFENSGQQSQFDVRTIPRVREVGQPWSKVPLTASVALIASVKVIMSSWPDLIICNGPGSCIPICMLAYIPRILGIKKIEIIYVESFARVESLSLTGKLLYPFVDRFLVQWPQLSNMLDKAEYRGILV